MAIMNLLDLQPTTISRDLRNKYLLIYGTPKCGKTSFAAECPKNLIFCFEKSGVLADVNDENSLVRMIDETVLEQMKASGSINSGMLPKIDNAMHALRSGVSEVYIKSAANLLEALGTLVIL